MNGRKRRGHKHRPVPSRAKRLMTPAKPPGPLEFCDVGGSLSPGIIVRLTSPDLDSELGLGPDGDSRFVPDDTDEGWPLSAILEDVPEYGEF